MPLVTRQAATSPSVTSLLRNPAFERAPVLLRDLNRQVIRQSPLDRTSAVEVVLELDEPAHQDELLEVFGAVKGVEHAGEVA